MISEFEYVQGENPWNDYFFSLCEVVSSRSKDRSTKVGAVITDKGNCILSTGYNGFPAGTDDGNETRHARPEKYLWTCHAEENAIAFAARNGHPLKDAVLYCNRLPCCARCTRLALQSGIRKFVVFCDASEDTLLRWGEESEVSRQMIEETSATLEIYWKSLCRAS